MLRIILALLVTVFSSTAHADSTCTERFGKSALATAWSSNAPNITSQEVISKPSATWKIDEGFVRVRAVGQSREDAILKACVLLIDRQRRGVDISGTKVVTRWHLNTGWVAKSEPIKPPDKNS